MIPNIVNETPAITPRIFIFFLSDINNPMPNDTKNATTENISRSVGLKSKAANPKTMTNVSGKHTAKLMAIGFIDNFSSLSLSANNIRSYNLMLYNWNATNIQNGIARNSDPKNP